MREFLMAMVVPATFLATLLSIRQYVRVRDMEVRLNPAWLEGLSSFMRKSWLAGEQYRQGQQNYAQALFPIQIAITLAWLSISLSFALNLVWSCVGLLAVSLFFFRKYGEATRMIIMDLEEDRYDLHNRYH